MRWTDGTNTLRPNNALLRDTAPWTHLNPHRRAAPLYTCNHLGTPDTIPKSLLRFIVDMFPVRWVRESETGDEIRRLAKTKDSGVYIFRRIFVLRGHKLIILGTMTPVWYPGSLGEKREPLLCQTMNPVRYRCESKLLTNLIWTKLPNKQTKWLRYRQ
jgi:hypothetical protein